MVKINSNEFLLDIRKNKMKTILKTTISVREICEGFEYNEFEGKGLFGLSGKLTIQPEYQRNYTEPRGQDQRLSAKKSQYDTKLCRTRYA